MLRTLQAEASARQAAMRAEERLAASEKEWRAQVFQLASHPSLRFARSRLIVLTALS